MAWEWTGILYWLNMSLICLNRKVPNLIHKTEQRVVDPCFKWWSHIRLNDTLKGYAIGLSLPGVGKDWADVINPGPIRQCYMHGTDLPLSNLIQWDSLPPQKKKQTSVQCLWQGKSCQSWWWPRRFPRHNANNFSEIKNPFHKDPFDENLCFYGHYIWERIFIPTL